MVVVPALGAVVEVVDAVVEDGADVDVSTETAVVVVAVSGSVVTDVGSDPRTVVSPAAGDASSLVHPRSPHAPIATRARGAMFAREREATLDRGRLMSRSFPLSAFAKQADIFVPVQMSTLSDSVVPVSGTARMPPAATSAQLPDEDEAAHLAALFRLLGDPTRVRILSALLEAGELCVNELAAAIDANETKVSQAMRLMRAAGVVRNRRAGRHIFYRLDDDHIRTLLHVSRDHLAHTSVAR